MFVLFRIWVYHRLKVDLFLVRGCYRVLIGRIMSANVPRGSLSAIFPDFIVQCFAREAFFEPLRFLKFGYLIQVSLFIVISRSFFLNYHVGCLLGRVFSEDVCCKEIVPGVRINILLGSIWFSCWFFFTLIFFFKLVDFERKNGLKRFSRDKCHLAPVILTTKAGISNMFPAIEVRFSFESLAFQSYLSSSSFMNLRERSWRSFNELFDFS